MTCEGKFGIGLRCAVRSWFAADEKKNSRQTVDWYRVGSLPSGMIQVPLKMPLRGLSVTMRVHRDRGGIERQLISLRGKENRKGGAWSPQELNSEGG